jgi:hypothetical protein
MAMTCSHNEDIIADPLTVYAKVAMALLNSQNPLDTAIEDRNGHNCYNMNEHAANSNKERVGIFLHVMNINININTALSAHYHHMELHRVAAESHDCFDSLDEAQAHFLHSCKRRLSTLSGEEQ